jgi:hypothetical protein
MFYVRALQKSLQELKKRDLQKYLMRVLRQLSCALQGCFGAQGPPDLPKSPSYPYHLVSIREHHYSNDALL